METHAFRLGSYDRGEGRVTRFTGILTPVVRAIGGVAQGRDL